MQLTKAEEQVMRYLWNLEKAYLKNIPAMTAKTRAIPSVPTVTIPCQQPGHCPVGVG